MAWNSQSQEEDGVKYTSRTPVLMIILCSDTLSTSFAPLSRDQERGSKFEGRDAKPKTHNT